MFELRECFETWLFKLGEPAFVDFLQRYGIEEVQLFAQTPRFLTIGCVPKRVYSEFGTMRSSLAGPGLWLRKRIHNCA